MIDLFLYPVLPNQDNFITSFHEIISLRLILGPSLRSKFVVHILLETKKSEIQFWKSDNWLLVINSLFLFYIIIDLPVAPQVYVIVVCRIELSVVISSDYDAVIRCDTNSFYFYTLCTEFNTRVHTFRVEIVTYSTIP